MTDTAVAEGFEGIFSEKDYYTDEQWEITNMYQRAWLNDDWDKNARDLMMSRMLRKPLSVMQKQVDDILGTKESFLREDSDRELPKFFIYSAHDTQIDSMLVFLSGDKESFDYVPFSSQIHFELFYSQSCVSGKTFFAMPSEECFGVSIRSNGEPMKLPGCSGDGFSNDETGCTYKEFKDYMKTIWYSGKDADDLNKACS